MKTKHNKLRGRAVLSLALAVGILSSMTALGSVPASADEAESPLYGKTAVQGGAILHCFDWSYNTIKANMKDIADAGYIAVQTSPVQPPKNYSSAWTDGAGQWWKLYQPISISVADGTSWLGTQAELKAMCDEADKYGIKVIVDVVANHMANNGNDGGTYDYISPEVESDMNKPAYFHTNGNWADDKDREKVTMGHIGMPDLYTGSEYVQRKYIAMLQKCVELGVDGFRFDAAKHIETPSDVSRYASDFWPNITSAILEAKSDAFIYGEILGTAGLPEDGGVKAYTKYMGVTDNGTGDYALNYIYSNNITYLNGDYMKGDEPSKYVIWAESHDTYMGNSGSSENSALKNTSGVSDDVIVKTWGFVGSRANSTSLFFARPSATMGKMGDDTTWKSTAVAEVNKFKNFFDGTDEYILKDSSYKTVLNERGSSGAVIVSQDGEKDVSISVHNMPNGSYTDHVTNTTFTVANGKISGHVGSSGVAVVYNESDTPVIEEEDEITYSLFGYINGANYACEDDYANQGKYIFENGWVKTDFMQTSYVAMKTHKKGDDYETYGWYMTDGWQGEVKSAVLYNTSKLGENANKLMIPDGTYYVKLVDNGDDTFTLSYQSEPPATVPEPEIEGREAVIGDDIGMNYSIDLDGAEASSAVMKFTYGDEEETVSLADITPGSNGKYSFTVHVAAKEMTDEITAELYVDGKVVSSYTDSVYNYLMTIVNNAEGTYSDSTVTLAKATLTYGAAAQTLFSYNTDTPANDGVTGYTPAEIDEDGLTDFNFDSADFEAHKLKKYGAALKLENKTMIRLYFTKLNETDSTFADLTDGNNTYKAQVNAAGNVYYDITGFEAGSLREDRTLHFTDSNATFTVNVDGYTKRALNGTNTDLKTVLKALYGYDDAAKAYSGT